MMNLWARICVTVLFLTLTAFSAFGADGGAAAGGFMGGSSTGAATLNAGGTASRNAASPQAMQNAAAQRGATQLNADMSAQSMDKSSAQSARSASTGANANTGDGGERNTDSGESQDPGSEELTGSDLMFDFEGVEDKRSVVRRGKISLKRFGYDFFTKRGRMQADPLSQVGPDYVVGPGDTLKIDM